MSIAFKCLNCQQPYKVKDDMAGKRVVCTACKKPIRVPAPTAAPAVADVDADALAVAALAEAPAAAAEIAAATITVECPNCIEQVTFTADKAGKQAPCPACRRVIKVPIPAAGKQDWRTADARPTFAKVQPAANLTDVVSTANMKIVDREALSEAGALRKRVREPLPLRIRVRRYITLGCVAVAIAVGSFMFMGRKTVQNRDGLVEQALKVVKDNPTLPIGVRAETYRAAGEYVLAQPDGQADLARGHFGAARNLLATPDTAPEDRRFEKPALLTRIALSQTGLVGDQKQIRAGVRTDWVAALKELRYTLAAFESDPAQWEGSILAVRGLTRSLGLRGATPEQPAMHSLVLGRFDNPLERADALAAVGLELFGTDEMGQKKAKEFAEQVRTVSDASGMARVVALITACNLGEPSVTAASPTGVRVGTAEGLARRGDLDAARKVADVPGSPEDRFQTLVAIAAIPTADPTDVNAAVEFFAKEFKTRDLPDWPLIHLSQICGESKAPDAAKKLNAALAELSNLSPRSQAVRAWAQMELLRLPQLPATDAAVEAIAPESALGHLLAWEVLAQRTGATAAPDAARPLGLVGAALGSMK